MRSFFGLFGFNRCFPTLKPRLPDRHRDRRRQFDRARVTDGVTGGHPLFARGCPEGDRGAVAHDAGAVHVPYQRNRERTEIDAAGPRRDPVAAAERVRSGMSLFCSEEVLSLTADD
jgi:hypothetical protein